MWSVLVLLWLYSIVVQKKHYRSRPKCPFKSFPSSQLGPDRPPNVATVSSWVGMRLGLLRKPPKIIFGSQKWSTGLSLIDKIRRVSRSLSTGSAVAVGLRKTCSHSVSISARIFCKFQRQMQKCFPKVR